MRIIRIPSCLPPMDGGALALALFDPILELVNNGQELPQTSWIYMVYGQDGYQIFIWREGAGSMDKIRPYISNKCQAIWFHFLK